MSTTINDKYRQIIPRFLDYFSASTLGLLRTIKTASQIDKNDISASVKFEWKSEQNVFSAVDLVGEAILIKDFSSLDAMDAAQYILNNPNSSTFMTKLAQHYLQEEITDFPKLGSTETYEEKIAKVRKFLRIYPSNPIAWSDLSLCFAALGSAEKSMRAMDIALGLSKNNRFILRSAAKCFVFHKEPDRALYNLQSSELINTDPWIASALVSIVDGNQLKTKYLGTAIALSKEDGLSDFSKSELNASLGTMELKHGVNKAARKLLRQSLVDPTENSLAQAQWMIKNFGMDQALVVDQSKKVAAPFECKTRDYYYNKKFEDCLKESSLWASFDPLNPDPVIIGSFVASTYLEDDDKALEIIDNATPAQKANPNVINNKIFSLIEKGLVNDGIALLNKNISKPSGRDKLTFLATSGFAEFRYGNPQIGRKFYNEAIAGFNALGDHVSETVAKYYYAREEKRLKSEYAPNLIAQAKDDINRYHIIGYEELSKKL